MKRINKYISVIALSSVMLTGCDPDLLDVKNQNEPDFLQVYAKGEDVANVAGGLYNTVYKGLNYAGGVKPMLAVAADNVTCSHGNFGMWHASNEPRDLAWDNSPSYSNKGQTKDTYDRLYSAIATANNVIKAINSGVSIGRDGADNDKVMAFSRFVQGLAYSNLALIYDRAHVVDEATSVEGVLETAVPYNEVAVKALAFLDQAITLSNGNFTIPASWMGAPADISSAEFKKIVNTYAATLLSYLPRNKAELDAVDWAKVKAYADAGITSDINVVMDGTTLWYDEAGDYLTYDGWGKTDMYVVHLMDSKQPNHWGNTANPGHGASTTADDQRLFSDFQFTPSNGFRPERGYFNFSNYRNKRYDDIYVSAIGPKPQLMKAENDMLRAEARVYQNDLQAAADIINAGTRVTRGKMKPVTANKEELIQAIHHERHVEMYTVRCGLQFFEMRKRDLLQKGTFLHFPLPADILQVFGATPPFYTFGTVAKADGKGTSNGGWR